MAKRTKPSVGPAGSAAPAGVAVHYWSGAHTRHRILVHLVLCPKYRHRVLEGAIALRVRELFEQCCQINAWYIQELNVQPDHVHLLLQVSPTDRLSEVVGLLKGAPAG